MNTLTISKPNKKRIRLNKKRADKIFRSRVNLTEMRALKKKKKKTRRKNSR